MTYLRTLAAVALTALTIPASGCGSAPAEESGPASEEDDVRARTTTLTFPLIGRERDGFEWKKVPLASLNDKLAAKGLPPFEKSITIGRNDKAKFEAIVAKVEAANAKLGREIEFRSDWDPSDYVGLCYNGIAAGVMKTVEANRGSAFPEYMGVQAERYGSKKTVHYSDGNEKEWLDTYREDHGGEVKVWETFDKSSDAFLFIADGGQQGDGSEFFPVLVPKCQ